MIVVNMIILTLNLFINVKVFSFARNWDCLLIGLINNIKVLKSARVIKMLLFRKYLKSAIFKKRLLNGTGRPFWRLFRLIFNKIGMN